MGCTGGRHRSVALAEALAERLACTDEPVSVFHRDIDRELRRRPVGRRHRRWSRHGGDAARRHGATPGTLTGVVSVADDGGSSGRLRELLNVVALGDIRKCLVALADEDSALARRLRAPLRRGRARRPRAGQPDPGRLDRRDRRPGPGVREAALLLGARGDVLPATSEPVVLKAESAHGTVAGQVAVMGTGDMWAVSLVPGDAQPPPLAVERILGARPGGDRARVVVHQRVGRRVRCTASPRRSPNRSSGRVRLQPPSAGPRDGRLSTWPDHVAALARHDVAVDVVRL